MHLAKLHLDVGLFTTEIEGQLSFWRQTVGLAFDHDLKVGDGLRQHRFHANGSIIKINHSEHPLPAAPASGISGVYLVSREVDERVELADPDGNRLVHVPPGFEGIAGLAVELTVADLDSMARFWGSTLQCPSPAQGSFLVGDSLIMLRRGERPLPPADRLLAPGWRYLTVQVQDCREEHRLALERGAVEAAPPRDRGGIATISFIRDPEGNFIELSERMSLKSSRPSS